MQGEKYLFKPPQGVLFAYMYYIPWKRIQRFPLLCFHLASSWSMMPTEVVGTMKPDWRDGSGSFCHFSRSFSCTSNLGLVTPHLRSLPVRFLTIFAARWSWMISNLPAWPCFIIMVRNLTGTLERGLIDGRLALASLLRVGGGLGAPASTLVCTIMAAQRWREGKYLTLSAHSFPRCKLLNLSVFCGKARILISELDYSLEAKICELLFSMLKRWLFFTEMHLCMWLSQLSHLFFVLLKFI